jgi:hypothetical protein
MQQQWRMGSIPSPSPHRNKRAWQANSSKRERCCCCLPVSFLSERHSRQIWSFKIKDK